MINSEPALKRFLIIKTSSLGDIIHAFPVLTYLKEKFPAAKIDWIVEKQFSELVKAHPLVDQILCVETKKWRQGWLRKDTRQGIREFRKRLREKKYDAVFDLQGNIKSGLITLAAKSDHKVGFGKKSVPEWPNCLFTNHRFNPPYSKNIREEYLSLVKNYFNDHEEWNWEGCAEVKMQPSIDITFKIATILKNPILQGRQKVMVCPGSAWRNKQMNNEALGDLLFRFETELNSSFLLIWGTEDEKKTAEELQSRFIEHALVIERLPLSGLQNLMTQVDLVIAMDSLPLHLAGTTKTPTYSIFGASLADKYRPMGSRHLAFQGSCPYGKVFKKRCPTLRSCPTGACIRDRKADEIFDYYVHHMKEMVATASNTQNSS